MPEERLVKVEAPEHYLLQKVRDRNSTYHAAYIVMGMAAISAPIAYQCDNGTFATLWALTSAITAGIGTEINKQDTIVQIASEEDKKKAGISKWKTAKGVALSISLGFATAAGMEKATNFWHHNISEIDPEIPVYKLVHEP